MPIPNRKIAVVMTNHAGYPDSGGETGLWLSELVHFFDLFHARGYSLDFVSPKGGRVPVDPRSVSRFMLDKVTKGYINDTAFMDRLKKTLPPDEVHAAEYDAIYFTGGHGVMWDFPESTGLQDLSRKIYESGGAVSAVCHGSCALLNVKHSDGKSLIHDKRVTGFSNLEEKLVRKEKVIPFSLEDELKARGTRYRKAKVPFFPCVVADGRLVTGQNPQSTRRVAENLYEVLKPERQRPDQRGNR